MLLFQRTTIAPASYRDASVGGKESTEQLRLHKFAFGEGPPSGFYLNGGFEGN